MLSCRGTCSSASTSSAERRSCRWNPRDENPARSPARSPGDQTPTRSCRLATARTGSLCSTDATVRPCWTGSSSDRRPPLRPSGDAVAASSRDPRWSRISALDKLFRDPFRQDSLRRVTCESTFIPAFVSTCKTCYRDAQIFLHAMRTRYATYVLTSVWKRLTRGNGEKKKKKEMCRRLDLIEDTA